MGGCAQRSPASSGPELGMSCEGGWDHPPRSSTTRASKGPGTWGGETDAAAETVAAREWREGGK